MFALLILIAVGIAAACGLTWTAVYYAKRHDLMDYPGERSSHTETTPRGGGIAIAIVTGVGGVLLAWRGDLAWSVYNGLMLGTFLVAGIGYLDDHRSVPARIRFIVHLLAAALVIFYLHGIPVIPIWGMELDLGPAGYVFGVLILAWFLNLYNFMDGTDGLAGLEAIFISLGMLLLIAISAAEASGGEEMAHSLMRLCLLVASGTLGFLLFNLPPAKIFMGDVGSGFLGFFLGSMGLAAVAFGFLNIWTVLILFGVFLVDATVTLLRRIIRGDCWYDAHRTHAYQHYVAKLEKRVGRSVAHRRLLSWVMGCNVTLLFPFAWLSVIYPAWGMVFMMASLGPIVWVDWRLGAGLPIDFANTDYGNSIINK